jgi:hypothetical protein
MESLDVSRFFVRFAAVVQHLVFFMESSMIVAFEELRDNLSGVRIAHHIRGRIR